MLIRISNLRLSLEDKEERLKELIAKKLKLSTHEIRAYSIIKKSLDARKNNILFVYTVKLEIEANAKNMAIAKRDSEISIAKTAESTKIQHGTKKLKNRPIVVGAGPAGLFAALTLASYGYKPLVIERGEDVEQRTLDIASFWETGQLKLNSNIQFGEGGAGTFSDGKLTTRINDARIEQVLKHLVDAGAPEEITYLNKPHLGTDKLKKITYNLRQKIEKLGGKVKFKQQVTNLLIEQKKVAGVVINNSEEIESDVVILAIGHSARDTYETLYKAGLELEAKPFAIGARIEHPQKIIDEAQFGKYAGHPKLGAADYQLVYNNKAKGKAAYTFCMCPGGVVVGAASEEGMVTTNGMSEYSRDTGIANSALVVSVGPEDFSSRSPLAGFEFQREWEQKAFNLGKGNYNAPVQKVSDFLKGKASTDDLSLKGSTYKPGTTPSDLHDALPGFVTEMMEEAIIDFGKRLKNFDYPDAVLTGVETRTSAPLRILRDKELQALNLEGLYPSGEGAGYAGGITSAAVDGIKVAEKVIEGYAKGEY